jgi:hypothetical protein
MKAQEQRNNKKQWVNDPANIGKEDLEWVLFERQTMLDLTNQERKENNLPPIPIEEIIRAENLAIGHCDYTYKFALYCAEISQDQPI